MRVLLLNLSEESKQAANHALTGQGYEIAAESGLNVDEVLTLSPDVTITEASPTDLSCCGMIAQLKARSDTRASIRVLMIIRGGALERARALDLGADDVISFPFEEMEFAARVRTQFRERQPEQELKTMLKYATQREQMADIAVESLSGGAITKHRFWLIPAIFVVSAKGSDADGLKQQLADTQKRLKLLESEGKVAETVVQRYAPSVCLLHVVVEFLDKQTGKPIQIAVDALGKPRVDDKGMVQLDIGGQGPHLQIDVFGTGFLVARDGRSL